jgi:hypothetical protein
LQSKVDFVIGYISKNVERLLGCYDSNWLEKQAYIITHVNFVTFDSIPLECLGNILYLVSKNVNLVGVNIKPPDIVEADLKPYQQRQVQETKMSLAYKYGEVLVAGCPCISKKPGYWINCRLEDLSDVEFQLVDWKFNPVKILNPIHISIEMEFSNNPLIR